MCGFFFFFDEHIELKLAEKFFIVSHYQLLVIGNANLQEFKCIIYCAVLLKSQAWILNESDFSFGWLSVDIRMECGMSVWGGRDWREGMGWVGEVGGGDGARSSQELRTPMKRPSSKLSPRKNRSCNTQTITSQTVSTNWTGQNRLFCSGWELGTTDLTAIYTTSSRLASLRCACAMQTLWLQNTYCSTVDCMICFEVGHVATTNSTEGQAPCQPGWAEEDSRLHEGNRHLHLVYNKEKRRI